MRLDELHKLNWATTPDKAQGWSRRELEDPNLVQVIANISDIMSNTEAMQRIGLNAKTRADDENVIGDRIQRAREHFLAGNPMNLSYISYNDWSKQLNFTDGRHRLVAAYQLGHEWAPVLTDRETLDQFKKLVRTR